MENKSTPLAEKPVRVQRKRTKGWRMPENTMCVTRPSKYGNPFHPPIVNDVRLSMKLFRNTAQGIWDGGIINGFNEYNGKKIYEAHLAWTARFGKGHVLEHIHYDLRGRNLACFCPLDQPCHADVLLELANK